jgi:arsenical pump membrane protein
MFATTFVANASSLGLPISNPINFLLTDSFGQPLPRYVTIMWLPEVASVAATSLLLFWLFRRDIRRRTADSAATRGTSESRIRVSALLLGLLIAAYVVASSFGFPLGIVASAGAIVFACAALLRGDLRPRALKQSISWPIFGFLAGMLVVIRGLESTGAIAALGRALVQLGDSHIGATIAVTTVGAAVGSNIVNNLPAAVTLDAALHQQVGMTGGAHTAAIYSTIIGCDIGPNLTHLGSLSSMIWLLILRRRGLDVSTLDYARVGVVLTPVALLAAAVALYFAVT